MTWDPNVPAANTSPGRLPAKAATNWARLQAIIEEDHNFATTADATEGYHTIIHYIKQGTALNSGTPTPIAGYGQLYTKDITTTGLGGSSAGTSEHVCYQQGTGGSAALEASVTAAPIRGAINFEGRTSNGDCTTQWAYNVTKAERTAKGQYKIHFENSMPSIYYTPFGMAMPESGGNRAFAQFKKDTYATTFNVDFLLVTFASAGSTTIDPQFASILIVGG